MKTEYSMWSPFKVFFSQCLMRSPLCVLFWCASSRYRGDTRFCIQYWQSKIQS